MTPTFVGAKFIAPLSGGRPDRAIVQQVLHKLPWGMNVDLLDAIKEPSVRRRYAEQAMKGARLEKAIKKNMRGLGYGC